jgi:hypothetical protein
LTRLRTFLTVCCLLLLPGLAGLILLSPAAPARAASTTLVINEVFNSNTSNPPGAQNEYIEVMNVSTSQIIDTGLYYVYNKNGRDLLPSISLQPGGIAVIPATSLPGQDIGQGTVINSVNIGLDSTADYVGLAISIPTDTAIDAVNWGTLNPNWFGYNLFNLQFITDGAVPIPVPDTGRSLQRFPDGVDRDSVTDWAFIQSSPGTPSCSDPYEDDDTISQAQPFSPTSGVQTHRICGVGDADWYRITMSTSGSYTIAVTATGNSLIAALRLTDSNGTTLVNGTPSGRSVVISNYRPTTSGDFYAEVTGNGGAAGSDWLYQISMSAVISSGTVTATPTPGGCDDAYEPDNSQAQARPLLLNTEQARTICDTPPNYDQDWVSVEMGPNKVYHIYTKDLQGPLDTVIDLYDSSGQRLWRNDDYPGRGLGSQIDWTVTGNEILYVRILDKTLDEGTSYRYTLGFTVDPGPLTPTASVSPTITPTPIPTMPACLDAYEGDGAPADAKMILINDVPQRRSFCPGGDADWIKFFAGRGKAYTIQTFNLPNGPAPGVDPYTYLFDSDGESVMAQNDDGGEGVNSRIDFFPVRDDYYYVQVKNKGDIGGGAQQYDIRITVLPGAPLPPGTSTPIIAPIVTSTVPPQPVPPTQAPPTQAPQPTTPPPPQATEPPPPTPTTEPPPTAAPPAPEPTQEPPPVVEDTPTPEPPVGLPPTGSGSTAPNLVSVPVIVYVDANGNGRYDGGEGVRDMDLVFRTEDGTTEVTMRTDRTGAGRVLLLRDEPQRLVIPYLRRTYDVTADGAPLLIRFPAPRLPSVIP